MPTIAPPDDAKAATRRRSRAADTRRWRHRCRQGLALYSIEIGPEEINLAVKYGGLREERMSDKAAVAVSVGKLLRRALVALRHEETRRR